MFFVSSSPYNVRADLNQMDPDSIEFRRKALRDAVICIGWLKLTSIVCYLLLYFMVVMNSKGHMSEVIKTMIGVIIPCQVIHGVLLFFGALERNICALRISLYLFLIFAAYNTVLGCLGSVHYIRTGYLTMHFLLAAIFAIMALSLITVFCYDIFILYAYIIVLRTNNTQDMEPISQEAPVNKYQVTEIP